VLSVKSMTRTAVAVCGAAALLGSGAQVASAAPALVNGGGTAYWQQPAGQPLTIVVKPSLGRPTITYSCIIPPTRFSPVGFANSGSPLQGWVHAFRLDTEIPTVCTFPSGRAYLRVDGVHQQLMAEKSGGAFSLTSPVSWNVRLVHLYGGDVYSTTHGASVAWSATVINGTGVLANPTKVVFSNTVIGNVGGGSTPMSLTGTLNLLNVQLS
jgi:hypothetical protein